MSEQIVICECRDCNEPMQLIQQARFNGGFLVLATCKNPTCLLRNVTLSIPEYVNKTNEQLEEYRRVNRRYAAESFEVGAVSR